MLPRGRSRRQVLGVALVAALSACAVPAQTGTDGEAPASDEPTTTTVGVRYEDPEGLLQSFPTWGIRAFTIEELAAQDVAFVGTVIAAEDGPVRMSEPGGRDNFAARWVTVRVDRVLTGEESVVSVVLAESGAWIWPDGADGEAIPVTPEGVPWLDIGETVFVAGNHLVDDGREILATPGPDGTFEVVDGRLVEPFGGAVAPLWAEIGGLSIDELEALLRAHE